MQTHLTLYRYRQMSLQSPDMVLAHQDLKFAHEFYSKIYDRRFSGRAENNPRPALLRESSLRSALHELEATKTHWYSYFTTWDFWAVVALGQVLSLCTTATNTFTTFLVNWGTSIPAFQTLFNFTQNSYHF